MNKLKYLICFHIAIITLASSCSEPQKKHGAILDGSQEINVVRDGTKLILSNIAKPPTYQLNSTRATTAVIANVKAADIRCEVTHVLPRSVKASVTTQTHKDFFTFKKKQILEERRTQNEAPFYTNRFKFTYTFLQNKANPSMDRQEIILVCQTEFASVQPAMDLTIKDINDIMKNSYLEIKQEIGADDLKDTFFKF